MDRTPDDAWEACLAIIRDNISRQSYRTWFEPLRAVALADEEGAPKLTVQLPSRFYYEWLEEHYFSLLRKTITKVLGPTGRLYYDIVIEREDTEAERPGASMQLPARPNALQPGRRARSVDTNLSPPPPSSVPRPGMPTPGVPGPRPAAPVGGPASPFAIPGVQREIDPHLDPLYTFDRFIEGDCNRLARSAAWAIAQHPGGTAFNPFLVYGGSGLGKTHLIQAIGNYARTHGKARTVRYTSSDQFTSEFVRAIKTNSAGAFAELYQSVDVLIVDDVQFFGGKEKTQEQFFHIFNELHLQRKQIVLSSDRPLKDIVGMEERLVSRFQWGLVADVQAPELETRIAILRRRAEDDGTRVSDAVLEYIATHITANIRELEGALIRLSAYGALQDREIDLEMAREGLRDLIKERRSALSIPQIQTITCDVLDIPEDLVRARTRKREVVQARQIAMFFSKQLTKHSLKTIGQNFGGRDHSTVIHAIQSVENQVETDPVYRDIVEQVRKKLELHAA
ncbi:MAG: chromosomal replication initiator protein DnaA [Bacteroidota bacterium]